MNKKSKIFLAVLFLSNFSSSLSLGVSANENAKTDTKTVLPNSLCLSSTKAILNSNNWAVQERVEVQNWLGLVQEKIENTASYKKMRENPIFKSSYSKSTYAFCIDSEGLPVGFHVLNRETFNSFDEQICSIVESCAPFPPAPNKLPWVNGGMRVELTLEREYKLSLNPDWPNKRLASAPKRSL